MKDIERTSPNSARAVRAYTVEPGELANKIEEAVGTLPHWKFGHKEGHEVGLVRESRLFKFEDDVTVSISDNGAGCEAIFESASRVGQGDLGQNPRNLRDLIEAVDRSLV
ncbi:MAG: DUF1499 domain-containing protein [Rubrobacteraceae bacterium]